MRSKLLIAGIVLPTLFPMAVAADTPSPQPFVDPLYSDNMVLQRDHKDQIWGWTTPAAKVTVTLAGRTADAVAGADGQWSATLPSLKAGGPYDLAVSGPQSVTFHNVLIGDVWVCSGQSNMEFGLGNVIDGESEIAKADYPNVRLFNVPHAIDTAPVSTVPASWVVCTPDNLRKTGNWYGFSAAGYYFGRELNAVTHVPIGLLESTWGGTPAEAWTPAGALQTMPDFKPKVDDLLTNASTVKLNPNLPTVLYNGMIAPLVNFGIKGAIWYQGESNAGRAMQYKVLLPTMITAWRAAWNEGDFPFYIVGLASYQQRNTAPKDGDGWADIWLAQRYTAHHLKNVGVTANYDIGDTTNIHPKDKADVGYRLALIALAQSYGHHFEYSGPDFSTMDKEGSTLRLHFDHVDGGLTASAVTTVVGQPPVTAEKLVGFQIAGIDKKWAWADAAIDGDTVVLSSPDVPDPTAARYCYGSNCAANLFNKTGLPALPFATDLPY